MSSLEDLAKKIAPVASADQRSTVMLKDVELIRELYGIVNTEDLKLLSHTQLTELFASPKVDMRIHNDALAQTSILISAFLTHEIRIQVIELDTDFGSYARKVLKQIHPELDLSDKASDKINQILVRSGARLIKSAVALAKLSGTQTLTIPQIEGAICIVLPRKYV